MPKTLNLGILAHVDAGKTSLTERILFHAGAIPAIGAVDSGTTQTDTMELERQRGITIRSAVVSFSVNDHTYNLIDTPGHPDFIAEVERSLGVLDAVVLVVSAVEGVQPQTRRLSRAIARMGLPCIIFVNKIDRMGARYDSLLAELRRELKREMVPLTDVHDLGCPAAAAMPRALADADTIDDVVNVLSVHEPSLLDRYVSLDGKMPDDELTGAFWLQASRGEITPVLFGSAMTGAGLDDLFAALSRLGTEQGQEPAEGENLSAEVFQVQRLPSGERVLICRIWAGHMHVRGVVPIVRPHAAGGVEIPPAKITGIERFQDGRVNPAPSAVAGDIVRVHGLAEARIGDWIGEPRHERVSAFEPPVFELRVDIVDPADRVHLNAALAEMADEDPLIGLRHDPVTGNAFIRLYGEVQREVVEATLRDDYRLNVTFGKPTVLCVERLLGEGRAAEIWGETNPPFYATVGFRVRPKQGERSTWTYTPGKAKKGFFDAAEEGGQSVLEQGPFGWPVIDWDVEVTDLIYLVTSVPVDYRKLAMLVMADAIRDAGTVVCEPVYDVTIRVPAESVGAVIHALSSQRGVIAEASLEESDAVVTGTIPAAEVDALTRRLPGLTNGRADIDARFCDYIPVEADPPVRSRTDMNPFDRKEFLSRLSRRF
jgi:ribosomal protection tetracycline resistance protein